MILLDLNKQELQEFLQQNLGVKKFVADQVFSWLNKGASFDQMTNVALATRQKLKEIAIDKPIKIPSSNINIMKAEAKKWLER